MPLKKTRPLGPAGFALIKAHDAVFAEYYTSKLGWQSSYWRERARLISCTPEYFVFLYHHWKILKAMED